MRKAKFLLKMLLYSAWLPLSIILIAFYRFFGWFPIFHPESDALAVDSMPMLWDFIYLLLITLPSAVPVTIAMLLIYRRTRITALIVGAITVPIATFAGLVGGLLGPLGVFLYVQAAGLPAWITLGILALIRIVRNRSKA